MHIPPGLGHALRGSASSLQLVFHPYFPKSHKSAQNGQKQGEPYFFKIFLTVAPPIFLHQRSEPEEAHLL